jgi:hypothetical protein
MIAIKNTVFRGTGSAVLLAQPPRQMKISNSLKTGLGTFLSLGPKSSVADFKLELDRVTLRQSGPLLRLAGECARKIGIAPLQIEAINCVFNLAEPRSGFITIESERPRSDANKSVEIKATESFVTPGTRLLVVFDTTQDQIHEIDADEQFEGLEITEIEFAGPRVDRPADAKTISLKGPRSTSNIDLPGIDPRQLGASIRTAALPH